MNQFAVDSVAKIIRQAVLTIAPMLGLSGVLEPYVGELGSWSLNVAAWLVAFAWGHLKAYVDKQKLLTATGAAGLTEKTVEAMVKDPNTVTPSVTTPKTEVAESDRVITPMA